ncbi:hypothetical protein HQ489_04445 [Candidatus Woesearchaeota archaeon]|nr:hypothetical protein [Candidatus Woesearchaeota archaeon]
MLGIKCSKCNSQLLRLAGYHDRKRLTVGNFCPECLVFVNYASDFYKIRDNIIKENKERMKSKPKFLKKQRIACYYCWNDKENPRENRSKWTIRKMPKKKDETQHWKCTCQLCGNVWTTNSGNEYHYYHEGYEEHESLKL